MSSIHSHDNNDNLGIILQGEISCLSLFGVKGSEKVYVSTVENLVCLVFFFFFFSMGQVVNKIGILINEKLIMYLIFYLS